MRRAPSPTASSSPPPNVTGSLHIGHALNNTMQDILTRFQRMRGKAALWLPGTDHAGIATQMVVERQLAEQGGPGRRDMGREAFVERVWEWKAQSGGRITEQLRRLGASCDWSRERFTLDPGLSTAVRKVFVTLHKQGLIYRDKRLVNWDPHFQTAISDLEVEQKEVDGAYWHFAYPLADGAVDGVTEIVVATTRPETMLGDTAVAVHPTDERYTALVGRMILQPITGRLIPIVADEYADPEKGSGAVKITPAHDFNDFQVGKRHGLEAINILDVAGRILLDPFFEADLLVGPHLQQPGENRRMLNELNGRDRFEARKLTVEFMDELGFLRGVDRVRHPVPHGDRSGVVIEPYLTDQWYVDAKALAQPAIAAVEEGRTVFEPRHWEKTYFEWMRNIEPWCISRQLWWGHRIPVWYGVELDGGLPGFVGEKVFVAETAEQALEQARKHYGREVVVVSDVQKAAGISNKYQLRSGGDGPIPIFQDEDVLDTWFSSALWPFSTLGWPDDSDDLKRFYPTSDLVTGFDIIFFWVARMMMMGIHFMDGEVPFRRVVINGLVRDEKGQKMSKSKGNVIDPLEVVDALGADALRFTMAILSGTRDIKLSRQRIEGYRNFGTKLWNAARFCQMNGCERVEGFDPGGVQQILNRWICGETVKTSAEVTRAIEAGAFDEAAQALYRFVWNVFCDWHLELAKPVFNGEDETAKAETRATTAWVLDTCLKLLHPVTPFITEELWERLGESGPARESMLIAAPWPDLPAAWVDDAAAAEIGWLIELVGQVRSIRAEMNVPQGARPGLTVSGGDPRTAERLGRYRELIATLARTGEIGPADHPPKGAAPFVLGGATFAVDIASSIDLGAERARLTKEVAVLTADIDRASRKLDNPDYAARAPATVVEETRAKLEDARASHAKLTAALERLAALA